MFLVNNLKKFWSLEEAIKVLNLADKAWESTAQGWTVAGHKITFVPATTQESEQRHDEIRPCPCCGPKRGECTAEYEFNGCVCAFFYGDREEAIWAMLHPENTL